MKTIVLTVLLTLLISQWLYRHEGPRNPVARTASAIGCTVSRVLDAAQELVH